MKETTAQHTVFLALIAAAVKLRLHYTDSALEIHQEFLNHSFEDTRKKLEEAAKASEEDSPARNAKNWENIDNRLRKAHKKYVETPMKNKEREEREINRQLIEIMNGVSPSGATILMTSCVEEMLKAKNVKDLLTIIKMYNEGKFEETFKIIHANEHKNQNSNNSSPIVDANGNPMGVQP